MKPTPGFSVSITVNGTVYECHHDTSLLRWLRDELKLVGVKDGCSQGACGTCTVIIDGKAARACTQRTKKLDGKSVVTIEGLSEREQEVYVYAFGAAGAVQCGFCTPGMVISAKALLDVNPDPSVDEVKVALKNNICRCTGYKKIIDAVLLAARMLRENLTPSDLETNPVMPSENRPVSVGGDMYRVDVANKILGKPIYGDDLEFEGMLYASCVRSEHPRARVLSIDTTQAEALEGVVKVFTAQDVPNNKVGHIVQDWYVMIAEGELTHDEADALAMVVAEDEETLEAAKKLVKVEYEVLETVSSIDEAKEEGARLVHEDKESNLCAERHVYRGDVEEALKNSAHVVTYDFETPFTEHAFLEPEVGIGLPYKDGVKVLSTDQGVYDTRKELAHMFKGVLEPEQIVVQNNAIGGGFGGKEDVSVQHLVALAAYVLQKPVKMKFTRDESIKFHPKRHPMQGTFTMGCDEEGMITGLKCTIHFDTGAYASLAGPVLERACTHSVGPYTYQNTAIDGYSWYTNNPPSGAFRGFGVCQSNFATECCINMLAEKVGISGWEIRYRNAIEPGKVLPNGQIADQSTAYKEALLAVKDVFEAHADRAGIAGAFKNAGVGVGLPDKGRAKLVVTPEGMVEIYSAASDIGQGSATVMVQVTSQTTNLPVSCIRFMDPNSELAPDSGTTSGSRQTLLTGEAVRGAAALLKEQLDAGKSLADLAGEEFFYEYFEPTDPLASDKPNPKSHIAYGYAACVVLLDDEGKVEYVYPAHDSGQVVNPIQFEGQIEGGVLMSMGYALTEQFKLDRSKVKAKYGNLGLLKSTDIPKIETQYVIKKDLLGVAYGAKGVGEIATIPEAAAIQNAYYKRDGIFRTKLPLENTAYSK